MKVVKNNFYSVHRATIKVYKQKLFNNPSEKTALNGEKNLVVPMPYEESSRTHIKDKALLLVTI